MTRSVALILNQAGATEQTTTALALVDRLVERGVTVRVFAHDEAAVLSAGTHPVAQAVAGLIRKGVEGGPVIWMTEHDSSRALGVEGQQAPGVIEGDHADLWRIASDADLVLSVGVGG
ncbi:hypothetical protein [Euzebya tangerina]|uniref:hypothetical protein n=1 Tax=Euzebya tangerina TaxID=591198 RepID=UPI000E315255|nr:hypothetical protein [Euzebya tangerina]